MNLLFKEKMTAQLYFLAQLLILVSTFIDGSAGKTVSLSFTASPRDTEYYVGTAAILEWEYLSQPPQGVQSIRFGYSQTTTDVAIFVKKISSQEVQWNPDNGGNGRLASLRNRTSVLKNRTASFQITNLTLNDTGTYFCTISAAREVRVSKTDHIRLTVVDLMIDQNRTTSVIESWSGHKIHLMCGVKVANPESEVRFTWEQGDRPAPIGRQVDWKLESQMTIVTTTASEFEPVICTARTAASSQRANITIKWLRKPSKPQNFVIRELHSNDTNCAVYNHLTWDPPLRDGGSPITGYYVEFKHPASVWVNESLTHTTEHVICKIQDTGHPRELHVNVRGVNKAGRGNRSKVKQVTFLSIPSAPLNLSTRLERKEKRPFHVKITWSSPDENGGSPVVRYSVEYKTLESLWKDALIEESNNTYMLISGERRDVGLTYEVRVSARNTIGLGPPSEAVNATFAEKPGAPEDLANQGSWYDDTNQPSIRVDWNPPEDDGGSEVTYYVVEYKTVKTKWSSATTVQVNSTKFSFQVEKSETYTVRVSATNRVGTGTPSNVISVKFADVRKLASSHGSSSPISSFVLLATLWGSFMRL